MKVYLLDMYSGLLIAIVWYAKTCSSCQILFTAIHALLPGQSLPGFGCRKKKKSLLSFLIEAKFSMNQPVGFMHIQDT